MLLPNKSCAGESPKPLMGVFLCCRSALATWSQFGDLSDLVLDVNILLAVFTADSALRFECGLYAALTWPEIPVYHGL